MTEENVERLRVWLREVQGIDIEAGQIADAVTAFERVAGLTRSLGEALPFEAEPSAFVKTLDDLADGA